MLQTDRLGRLLIMFALLLAISTALLHTVPTSFALPDSNGAMRRFDDWREHSFVALVFVSTDCPLVRLYQPTLAELAESARERGGQLAIVASSRGDTPAKVAAFAKRFSTPAPILLDRDGAVAKWFNVKHSPEVVLLDRQRAVRYRGRIDDQYSVLGRKPNPSRRDLALAIDDLIAERPISVARTEASGCVLERRSRALKTGPSYKTDIRPLLDRYCCECHRPGQIGPFSMLRHADIVPWADTIREVVEQRRMPPWHASPDHGRFANDRSLPDILRKQLLSWLDAGCANDDCCDESALPVMENNWAIPTPDRVIDMGREFAVPATGVVDYQYFEVDPGFSRDVWIRAAEVRPSARSVVHHVLVFIKPPGATGLVTVGELGNVWLASYAVGSSPLVLPEGLAKKVPAGSKLIFQMHYSPNGAAVTDRTELGLVFADPRSVRKEVATRMPPLDIAMKIAPGEANFRHASRMEFDEEMLVLSLTPHMHRRGKAFRYEAKYPDGRRETLLDVPHYDFNWQTTYILAEPKRLPRGTIVHCLGVLDNSAANPNNPDPTREVPWGEQSWDEMVIGYVDVVRADEDLLRPPTWADRAKALGRGVKAARWHLALTFVLAGLWWGMRRTRSRRTS